MKKRLFSFVLVSAMLLSLPGCGGGEVEPNPGKEPVNYNLIQPAYPQQIQYPNADNYTDQDAFFADWQLWRDQVRNSSVEAVECQELAHFLSASIPEFVTGTSGNEIYSPVNVYMALSMLAELTDGNSRAQILELLGEDSIEDLRTKAATVWNSIYRDDGTVTSILASSIWLHDEISFVPETMQTLVDHYYAAYCSGEMGSDEMNQALRTWINEQTGGLLEEQASDLQLDPNTILALATTIYFRAKWSDEFNPDRTTDGEFMILSPDGGTFPCKFMQSSRVGTYYWSDKFSAVAKELENGGKMWFILPDYQNGVFQREVLEDPVTMDFLLADGEWENQKRLIVNLSVPKFDVANEFDLIRGLQNLGVTDIFDPNLSDFSPTTADASGIILSQAEHAARVAIDEEGVTAAAYTVMAEAGAAMPPKEEVDFILDRPFLFAVTSQSGLPLFVGVVQNPN